MNLKTNKSTPGLDKIPAKVLKLTTDIIAPSLSYIFNLSQGETGIYVDDWKRARVNPIQYKSDDRLKCEKYI